jgi:GH25 family lysozyme M1 (1,4-beta-N-acetylmuramidase)
MARACLPVGTYGSRYPRSPVLPMPRHSHRPSRSASLTSVLVGLVAVFATSFVAPQSASAADPVGPTEGIDISHWQGDIDWSQVRASGKAFAFMKASEDIDFIDATYGLNRARATAAGFVIGAYHFAQPDASLGDAAAEADHFLDTAQIADGDLPPVLDLETTGGLTPAALQTWAQMYLERIRARTGVRGVIYTSPNFWSRNMAGTDWFATNGYRVVWVAHWTTSPDPTVPASDWAGFGWTFWQYTSDGSVPGITGRVDLDRFDGVDFSSVVIDVLAEGADAAPPKPPFKDIKTSKFRKDIAWLYASGITVGCSKTRFCPNDRVTRGQMASFLARALKLPKAKKDYFRDDNHSTHEANINRLAKAGLAIGCGTKRFCPDQVLSRGQLASFVARVLDLSRTSKDYFRDDNSSSHEAAINEIARAGLTSGCAPHRYCPTGPVTRGQMAAFLHRTFGY